MKQKAGQNLAGIRPTEQARRLRWRANYRQAAEIFAFLGDYGFVVRDPGGVYRFATEEEIENFVSEEELDEMDM